MHVAKFMEAGRLCPPIQNEQGDCVRVDIVRIPEKLYNRLACE